ncbi:MAG: hypothetical protein O8C61_09135 [Candidatus Methanoperedens sp.]|nr:hypothetical protein [Candidatus Methanoperedens sp.]
MKKIISILSILVYITVMISGAYGAYNTPQTYNVPRSFEFSKNYYNVYGSPDIQATIIGSNEFDRGQTVTLLIDLMNKGEFLGFDVENTPSTVDEIFAAQTEIKLEGKIVDATGISASLSADPDSPLEVKSISQQVGSIQSGQNSLSPVKFDIKIDKLAEAGEYNLLLNLTYNHQQNVQIIDSNATTQTYDANYWYGMMKQNQTLKIKVKKQAEFEIIRTNGSLVAGNDGTIEVTFKNTGEEEARDVKAIITPSDPISTTDDKAYLNKMEPGNVAVATFKINADSKAVNKTYAIDTVLRYQTPEGDIKYSDILQTPVNVREVSLFERLFGWHF